MTRLQSLRSWPKTSYLSIGPLFVSYPDRSFESTETFKEFCPVWVDFVDLLAWLWGNIRNLASQLGTPLSLPSNRNLGKALNRICVCWDIRITPPEHMVIDVGGGLIVVQLKFGTYFGACFKCNGFGHFA